MSDEECPHGLEREWCSLCKQQSAAVLPAGVKRNAPKLPPRARSTGRAATRPAGRADAAPPVARTPIEALATTRRVLFHATAAGSWPSIASHGLHTAARLAGEDPDAAPLSRPRSEPMVVRGPEGATASIRDQRPMMRANIEHHLDGIDLADWMELLNERVFLFTQQKDLTTLLSRYVPAGGQDVITFDTAKLLRAASGRVEVAAVTVNEPTAWAHCPCRGVDTFVPIDRYRGPVADIEEVAVVGGIDDVAGLVTRVVRYHADRTIEVLFP